MAATAAALSSNGGALSLPPPQPQPHQSHLSSLDDEMREHQQMERIIAEQAATAAATAAATLPVATSRRGAGSKLRASAARTSNAANAVNGASAAAIDAAAAGASTPAVAAAASHGRKRGGAVSSLSLEEQQRLADQAHLLGTSVASIAKRTRRASIQHKSSASADGDGDSASASSAADADAPFAFLAATKPLLLPEQERPIPNLRSRAVVNVATMAAGSNGSADSAAAAAGAAPLPAATLSSALSALLPSTQDDEDDASSSTGADASDKKNGGASARGGTRKRKPSAKAAAAAAQAMKGSQDIRALFGKQSPPAPAVSAGGANALTPAGAAARKKVASSSADAADDFMEDVAGPATAGSAAAGSSRTPPRRRSKARGSTAGATPKRQSARHATPIVIDGDDAGDAAASVSAPPPTVAAGGLLRTSSVASAAPPASMSSTPPSAARPVAVLVTDGLAPAAAAAAASASRKGRGGRKRSRAATAADDAESVASDAIGSAAPILPPMFTAPATAASVAAAPAVATSATAFRMRSKAGPAELYFTPPSSTPSAASATGTGASSGSVSMSSLALSMGSSSTDDGASAMFLAVSATTTALVAAHPDTLVVGVRHSARVRKTAVAVAPSEDAVAATPSKRRKRAVSPAPLAAESPVAIAVVSARKLALRSPLRSKFASGVSAEHKEPVSPTASEVTATSSSGAKGSKGKPRRNAKCCRPRGLQKQIHCTRCSVGHTIPCTGLTENEIQEQQNSWLCRSCSEPEHVGEVSASPPQLPIGAQVSPALATTAAAAVPAAAPALGAAAAARPYSTPAVLASFSISPVSLAPAAASASPPVLVLRRPLMPLPLPIPSPSMEDEEEEQSGAAPFATAAPFVAPLVVAPQPRQASSLQRSFSEQFESAPTPRIAARTFEDLLAPSSFNAPAAAAARRRMQSEDAEMKSLEVAPAADEFGSAAMPMVLDNDGDGAEEQGGGGPGLAEGEGEAERDEEEEAIASISTPAPLSPLSSAVAHEEGGGAGASDQQPLQHRTLSTAITPPLSPSGGDEGFPLSQEDECETGPQDSLETHDPDLSMDSPDLSQYHLQLTPPDAAPSRRGATTAPPSSATAAAAAAAAPSPLQPARAVSNASHSSTLTRFSVQLNGEPHAAAAAAAPSSAAAAAAQSAKLGRATRSPQTLQRAHATSSNQALQQQQQQQPSPIRRPTRALAAAAASAAGSAASKSSKPLHYTMSDLQTTSWHLDSTPAFPFDVHAAAATCQGWFRSKNQDTFICEAVRVPAFGGQQQPPPLLILGVADGHGILGHLASAVCAARMPLLLKDLVLLQDQSLEEAVTHAIAVCHAEINERAEQIRGVQPPGPGQTDDDQDSSVAASSAPPRRNGQGQQGRVSSPSRSPIGGGAAAAVLRNADFGTTIVMCVIQGSKMCVAHVGDSRCIILQREQAPAADADHGITSSQETPGAAPFASSSAGSWLQSFVTSDHNGENSSERARVRSEGGSLLDVKDPSGDHREYRVYPSSMSLAEAREMSLTINMTRALGHIKLGQEHECASDVRCHAERSLWLNCLLACVWSASMLCIRRERHFRCARCALLRTQSSRRGVHHSWLRWPDGQKLAARLCLCLRVRLQCLTSARVVSCCVSVGHVERGSAARSRDSRPTRARRRGQMRISPQERQRQSERMISHLFCARCGCVCSECARLVTSGRQPMASARPSRRQCHRGHRTNHSGKPWE